MQLNARQLAQRRSAAIAAGLGFAIALAGCSGNKHGGQAVSPSSAAGDAMTAYDANSDGTLDAKELGACPALQSLASKLNKDKLAADDISARLAAYNNSGAGRITYACTVLLDGNPLDGATVTFVPEKFLGAAFKPARATSQGGQVEPVTEGDSIGISLGMYRVEVSKQDASGRETIPAKYNAQTTLGCEIGPGAGTRGEGATVFRVSSK